PSRAYRAVWAFAASPENAIPYLRKRLQPIASPDKKEVGRLIDNLSDNSFQVRQQAYSKLQGLGDLAVSALRQRLAGNPSPEVKQRIEKLLVAARGWSVDQLQVLRAIQALEYMGTPD